MVFPKIDNKMALGTMLFLFLSLFVLVGCGSSDSSTSAGDATAAGSDGESGDVAIIDDIPVGFTEDGYPYRGASDAPITVYEYSDYLCPFCGRHTNQSMPALLDQYARTGKVKFVFRDFPIEALHPTADIGHLASLCVSEQGAPIFWQMHDLLFARQAQWNGLPDPSEFVVELAREVGADMDSFEKCFTSDQVAEQLAGSIEEARDLGFNGTPSFQFTIASSDEVFPFIGAQPASEFARWFDTLAANGAAPVEPTPEPRQLAIWLTADGLSPDPNRPGYTIAGDAYKGNPEAELVVVELSDFQCPSCRVHSLETQPAIDEELVETGQVMWVMKNLPVSEHNRAPLAAAAAECAGDQDRFWQMHELLFENQVEWSDSSDDEPFLALARQIDLDMSQFEDCLSGRAALEQVLNDLFEVQQSGIFRTPTFIMLYGGDAVLLEGSRETIVFIGLLENALDDAADAE
jgi:protein-disulfide isomerase